MNLHTTLVEYAKAARAASDTQGRNVDADLFKNPEASATELFLAARRRFGPDIVRFEPETLWVSYDVEAVNRDQLLAAINVVLTPSFWEDFRVFGNTALAFGDHAVVPDQVPRPEARDMAWAVLEAEVLAGMDERHEPHFDEEVAAYVAVALHHEGFVRAPDLLEFAQDALDRMTSLDVPTPSAEVGEAWDAIKDLDLERMSFSDDFKGVQLARLAEVRLYLVKRASSLVERLRRL